MAVVVGMATAIVFTTVLLAVYLRQRQRLLQLEELADRTVGRYRSDRDTFPYPPSDSERASPQLEVTKVVPAELADAIGAGRCVLFVGVQASMAAPLVSPTQLVDRLLPALREIDNTVDWTQMATELAPRDVAEVLGSRLPPPVLAMALLEAHREADAGREPPPVWVRELGRLPFAAAVTTAWDDAVERAFAPHREVIKVFNVESPPSHFADAVPIMKLRGDLSDPASLLLSLGELRRTAVRQPALVRLVSSLLASNSVLFVGMTARDIDDVLSVIDTAAGTYGSGSYGSRGYGSAGGTYAICATAEPAVDFESLAAKHRVIVLRHGGPEDLTRLVAHLSRRVGAAAPSRARQMPDRLRLERVAVENIGPFDEFELVLDPRWTALLGDNGAGKTSLLRAIALALSGSDATSADAARLLKTGAQEGRVTVTIGGVPYTTALVRDRRVVRVLADKVTPVQSGALLALGFTSLRGAPTSDVTGPRDDALVVGGDPADLASLRAGGVDHRLDDVRQWLVNLAVRAESMHSRNAAQHELRIIFKLMNELIPGLALRYVALDTQQWQLQASAKGVVAPLETLSQGTLATLTWAGTLLARLYTTYRGDEGLATMSNPAAGPALLLVDELDLHLHPAWQRTITTAISKVFPGTQVIATTHSPLIVGSLGAGQVVQVERGLDGRVTASRPRSFEGWRADQILTSDAFGLATTRDIETESELHEYEQLVGISDPTPTQAERRKSLEVRLGSTVPRAAETAEEREAGALLDDALLNAIEQLPKDRRAALEREATRYLRRMQSGE